MRRPYLTVAVIQAAALGVLIAGCTTTSHKAASHKATSHSAPSIPLCTEQHHEAPCIANGDNEPTYEAEDPACFTAPYDQVAPECWEIPVDVVNNVIAYCPPGSHLNTWEDGSGGCYDNSKPDDVPGTTPVVRDGWERVWPEDTFAWDCRTMGNRVCGDVKVDTSNSDPQRVAELPDSWECGGGTCLSTASWKPVPQDWADALAEGGDTPDADTRDWESCWISVGDTTFVVCPDGTIETS